MSGLIVLKPGQDFWVIFFFFFLASSSPSSFSFSSCSSSLNQITESSDDVIKVNDNHNDFSFNHDMVGLVQIRPGQIWSGQIGSGQIGSGQIGSTQKGSGQME